MSGKTAVSVWEVGTCRDDQQKVFRPGADLLWFDSVRTNPPVWLYVPYPLSASMIVSDSAADLQTD